MFKTGLCQKIDTLKDFLFNYLPYHAPQLKWDTETINLYGNIMYIIGHLIEMTRKFPDSLQHIKAIILKEVLFSPIPPSAAIKSYEPILYPSYYFKKHQMLYYQKFDGVRTKGDFEGWLKFYLKVIHGSSIDAYARAKDIETLSQSLQQLILSEEKFSAKTRDNRLSALSILFNYPVISISELSSQLDLSYNTTSQIISDLVKLQILQEDTHQKRGKLFKFKQYLDILEKEYDKYLAG